MDLVVKDIKIGIIGLGYVGLPLAIEFAKKYKVLGFDINPTRIEELNKIKDHTREADMEDLAFVIKKGKSGRDAGLHFSYDVNSLISCNVYIVTVPTPIDQFNNPDLSLLRNVSSMLGEALTKGDIVIYESTVYPGCTEEECVPILEKVSRLKFNIDFFCGYSPERINPGDKVNTLVKIKKVTSGSTEEIAEFIDCLYRSIIVAGTYKAPSIKVAEASKAIENAQRDLNISFVNELAIIFDKIGIDTNDVLDAAATKWNFLKYKPGLVGGHCISVDPYYLAQKAISLGYQPDVILSGRRVNNSIAPFIANKTIKLMIEKGHKIKGANTLIMGVTFKENCPDIRNTKVFDIYKELAEFGINVDIYDPWANKQEVSDEYNISLIDSVDAKTHYEAIIVTVAHDQFKDFDYKKYKEKKTVIFDVKACLNRDNVDVRL